MRFRIVPHPRRQSTLPVLQVAWVSSSGPDGTEIVTTEIRLWDKVRALELLGKHLRHRVR